MVPPFVKPKVPLSVKFGVPAANVKPVDAPVTVTAAPENGVPESPVNVTDDEAGLAQDGVPEVVAVNTCPVVPLISHEGTPLDDEINTP